MYADEKNRYARCARHVEFFWWILRLCVSACAAAFGCLGLGAPSLTCVVWVWRDGGGDGGG